MPNMQGLGSVNATGINDQNKKSSQLGTGVLGQKRPVSVTATGKKGSKNQGGYPGVGGKK